MSLYLFLDAPKLCTATKLSELLTPKIKPMCDHDILGQTPITPNISSKDKEEKP
jgi:hypothetical protein